MSPSSKRILLIDDSDVTLEILTTKLEHDGYVVESASDGEEGLRRIRENPPDLVFCDIMLPKVDGWSVLAEVRRDEALRLIPIVMMTAYTTIQFQGERAQAIDHGAVEYLRKPFDLREVSELAKRLLGA